MALYSKKNLYPGINIHLNSSLQSESGNWRSFMQSHIVKIGSYLDTVLPSEYFTMTQPSLQLGNIISHLQLSQSAKFKPTGADTKLTQLAIPYTLFEQDTLMSEVVYKFGNQNLLEYPVARIELLTTSSKFGGEYHTHYIQNRQQALEDGVVLIEIDYLHETPSCIPNFPNYREEHSPPYRIYVTIPRPSVAKGKTIVYGWGVVDPFPLIKLLLLNDDETTVDFGIPYNHTFETMRLYHRTIDYAQDPTNIDTYTDEDKVKIHKLLDDIRQNLSTPN